MTFRANFYVLYNFNLPLPVRVHRLTHGQLLTSRHSFSWMERLKHLSLKTAIICLTRHNSCGYHESVCCSRYVFCCHTSYSLFVFHWWCANLDYTTIHNSNHVSFIMIKRYRQCKLTTFIGWNLCISWFQCNAMQEMQEILPF